jgi:hypothetical protein
MKKTLKRIAPLQFGKVAGIVYGLISLIFVPFFFIFAVIGSFTPHTASNPSPLIMIGMSLVMAIIFPIIYGVMGFVFGALSAWAYNLIANWVGGIEVDVE